MRRRLALLESTKSFKSGQKIEIGSDLRGATERNGALAGGDAVSIAGSPAREICCAVLSGPRLPWTLGGRISLFGRPDIE